MAKNRTEVGLVDLSRASALEEVGASMEITANTRRAYEAVEKHFFNWGIKCHTKRFIVAYTSRLVAP